MNKITLIFDNAGGLTVQATSNEHDECYQRHYQHMDQAADDVALLVFHGEDFRDWDDPKSGAWLEPTDNELQNGGYVIASPGGVKEVAKYCGWHNVQSFNYHFRKIAL